MRDPWNVLDFIVVIIGIISLMPNVPNLKSLRTMRVLRPLRSINAVPSMKRLVATLLMSLPQMGYLVSFIFFFITVFAILGMQLFIRKTYYRCRLTDAPVFNHLEQSWSWPIDQNQTRLCGGIYECNPGTYCHALLEERLPLELDQVETWDQIQYGFFHFDNIGVAILSIFRVITLEGWTGVMYNYLDSVGFIAGLYFPLLIIICSFFLLNLFLAVIMETFSEMSEKQKEIEEKKKENEQFQRNKTLEKVKEVKKLNIVDKMIKVTQQKLEIKKSQPLNDMGDAALMYMANQKKNSNVIEVGQQQKDGELFPQINLNKSKTLNLPFSSPNITPSYDPIGNEPPKSINIALPVGNVKGQFKEEIDQDFVGPAPIKEEIDLEHQESEKKSWSSGTKVGQKSRNKACKKTSSGSVRNKKKGIDKSNSIIASEVGKRLDSPGAVDGFISEIDDEKISPIDQEMKVEEISDLDDDIKKDNGLEKPDAGSALSPFALIEEGRCASWKCAQKLLLIFCESSFFTLVINLSIIMNTLCLGLDSYPTDYELQSKLDIVNIAFFVLFFFEMLVKIGGMGPKMYLRDSYNIFDAFIVSLSIIDVGVSYSMPSTDDLKQGKGAISAFRAFRLLRVFKLAKSWSKLKQLLETIMRSLKDISSFSVLLFLLMFIYVLLGMEIFAETRSDIAKEKALMSDFRLNFNTFLNGFIVVFTVLTGENWDDTMFQFARKQGYISIFFFISLQIIGVMIFLNLFLAILLENFDDDPEEEEEKSEGGSLQKIQKMFKQAKKALFRKLKQCKKKGAPTTEITVEGMVDDVHENMPAEESREFGSQSQLRLDLKRVKIQATQFDSEQVTIPNLFGHDDGLSQRECLQNELTDQNFLQPPKRQISNLAAIKEIDEDNSPNVLSRDPGHLKFKQGDSGMQSSVFDNRYGITSAAGDNLNDGILHDGDHNFNIDQLVQKQNFKTMRSVEFDNHPEFGHNTLAKDTRRSLNDTHSQLFKQSPTPPIQSQKKLTTKHLSSNNPSSKQESMEASSALGTSPNRSQKTPRKSINIAIIMQEKQQQKINALSQSLQNTALCEGNSLFILNQSNPFRCLVMKMVKSQYFEMFILILIGVSSVLLALDNPINDPNSTLVEFLRDADIILTIFFSIESISKIIAYGFLFNKESSYLRNGWNIIDFIVVIISIISLIITSNKLKIVKILRLLRVLRPLRVISRNKGLKIGIQALFMAVPSLLNVIIVSMLFFLIFGIIGVNYFKGTFYRCTFGEQLGPSWYSEHIIDSKWDCFNYGGAWINADQTFDNVAEAMSTLFQMSTTEGWIGFMNRGVDAVAIDYEPQRNFNIYWAFFFIFFIILGNFLILNLFVGVVVSTFNREKEILGKNFLLTDKQKQWLDQKRMCMSISPKVIIDTHSNCLRQFFLQLVQNRQFDIFILICTILNTLVLTINWYSQTVEVDDFLDYINYGFAAIFLLEALFKLIGFGLIGYFRCMGNCFDFFIVIASIVSSVISLQMDVDFGSSMTFIRALRLARIFKYIKESQQIKIIFETLIVTIPALTNIGGLLLLFLYIYSVLGVFLFAEVKLQSTLNVHANFQSFGLAFLTLLRCSTGEAWDDIMMDTVRQRTVIFQCSEDDFDYDQYVANGYQTSGCGSQAGIIFFVTYFLMVPLIFLNLFIAIILEGFEQTSKKVNTLLSDDDLEKFRDCWAKFDKNGTGFIKLTELADLMLMLGEPLGWSEEEYKDNTQLQDDFMEELNIRTYNGFKEYMFYDVVQALTKVYMVKMNAQKLRDSGCSLEEFEDQDIYNTQNSEGNSQTKSERDCKLERKYTIDKDLKLQLRMELEFENFDDERQEILDVEEVKRKETRLNRAYQQKKDECFTSAHIKAARKILQALKRLRENKLQKQEVAVFGQLEPYAMLKRTLTMVSQKSNQSNPKKHKPKEKKNSKGPRIKKQLTLKHQSQNFMKPEDEDEEFKALPQEILNDLSTLNMTNMNLLGEIGGMEASTRLNRLPYIEEAKNQFVTGISGVIQEYEELNKKDVEEDLEELKADGNWNEEQIPSKLEQVPIRKPSEDGFTLHTNTNQIHAPADLELKSISDIEEVDPTTTVDGTTTNVGMVFSLKEDKVPKKVNGLVLKANPKDELEEKQEKFE